MTEAARLEVVVGFTDKATKGLKNVSKQFATTTKSITSKVSTMTLQFAKLAGITPGL